MKFCKLQNNITNKSISFDSEYGKIQAITSLLLYEFNTIFKQRFQRSRILTVGQLFYGKIMAITLPNSSSAMAVNKLKAENICNITADGLNKNGNT